MLEKELDVAIKLARSVAEIITEFQKKGFNVEEKGRNNPVTDADKAANEFLIRELSCVFPNDEFIGEESINDLGSIDVMTKRVWFIDPIDGTKDFIKGNGEWSIMIGLAVEGRPVLGVVFQAEIDMMYYGIVSQGAFLEKNEEKEAISVTLDPALSHATVVHSRSHPDPSIFEWEEENGITKRYMHGSIGCKIAQISSQRADLYFNLACRCHMWDTCAPEAILIAAGGKISTLDGNLVNYTGNSTRLAVPFYATSLALDSAVRKVISDFPIKTSGCLKCL